MYKIPANTLFIGHSLVFMPECHSTNTEASRLIQLGKALEGTVVITDNQTAGRGQREAKWISEPGKNFTFSIILKPSFLPVKEQFYLNMAISLGIADYLKEVLQEEIKIKWPNDILIHNTKLCGILIENQLSAQQIQYSIAGIGLNVNQQAFSFERVSSMKVISGKQFDLEQELPKLLKRIEWRYLMIRDGQQEKLLSDYLESFYWLHERHMFAAAGKKFEGTITGIDDMGRLLIEGASAVNVYSVKEIEFLY